MIKNTYPWRYGVDYRLHPEEYRVGKGEQGVLICEPFKSEILPLWRFRTPEIAQISSIKIFELFKEYLKKEEFVGADMARKFLQMGYTRARRYVNHNTGRKYDKLTGKELPLGLSNLSKAKSARIFYKKWKKAETDFQYKQLKKSWKEKYG
ncbi:cytoplasmic protein [Candidatus Paracaedimonas acanthamoebae]|nr:cytoplasmic protein [Candidatus Paracaedimonas acanthamoebae]